MQSSLLSCMWFAYVRFFPDKWFSIDLDSQSFGSDIGKWDNEVVDMLDIALGRLEQLDTGAVGAIQYGEHQT